MTTIQKNPTNTVKQSVVHDPHDWMRFEIKISQLNESQRDAVMEFVRVIGGNVDSFLFRDEFGWGYQVARQDIIASAAGGETSAQMFKTDAVGSESRDYNIWNIENNATFTMWKNGTPTVPGVVNYVDDGTFTFAALAPADKIEASCDFLRRCRFAGSFDNILRAYDLNEIILTIVEEGVE